MRDEKELFEVKDNAKIWPSQDPGDRPSYSYTCKLCGKRITVAYSAVGEWSARDRHVETHYLRYKGEIE